MAKPKSKPARSPYLDSLAAVRGQIRSLSAGIESHLNVHAAWWRHTTLAGDARRLAHLFEECARLQADHNAWEKAREEGREEAPRTRGHWLVLRNGVETVDYGTSFEDARERMHKAAECMAGILRQRYPGRPVEEAANRDSVYLSVPSMDAEGKAAGFLQREWFTLQNIGRD